jgi:catalase-peroxidase
MMTTADLALRLDPAYEKISRRFLAEPAEFADAFARAWFKLTHRDMGPRAATWALVPRRKLIWQDPVPAVDHPLVDAQDIAALKAKVLASGLTVAELVSHGLGLGLHLPRQRQARRRQRRAHPPGAAEGLGGQPAGRSWAKVLRAGRHPEGLQRAQTGGKKVSLADLIVLAGCAAVEAAAPRAGHEVTVPFTPGRTDASQEQTDVDSFAVLEPQADGFRNYVARRASACRRGAAGRPAQLLTLSAPEMTVLVGGLRVLGANVGQAQARRVHPKRPGTLSNDFFVNLLDMGTPGSPGHHANGVLRRPRPQATGALKWTGTVVDLVFGSNSQLRALAEVLARRRSTAPRATPTPVVLMKTPSPLPFSTTLVSPVTMGTPASRRRGHRFDDALQIGQRKAFFDDEAGRQVQRRGTRHGHVVDRAVHRQAADVAAGKNSGEITWPSVAITSRPGSGSSAAPSWPWRR